MPIKLNLLGKKSSIITVVFVLLLSIFGDYISWRLNQHNRLHEVELQISRHLDQLATIHRLKHSQLLADYMTLNNHHFQQSNRHILLLPQ